MKLYKTLYSITVRALRAASHAAQAQASIAVIIYLFDMRQPQIQCDETPRHGVDGAPCTVTPIDKDLKCVNSGKSLSPDLDFIRLNEPTVTAVTVYPMS